MYRILLILLNFLLCIIAYNYIYYLYVKSTKRKYDYLLSIGFIANVKRIGYKGKTELQFVRENIILNEQYINEIPIDELKEKYR